MKYTPKSSNRNATDNVLHKTAPKKMVKGMKSQPRPAARLNYENDFRLIESNKYPSGIERKLRIKVPKCVFLPESNCSDNCINHSTFYECDTETCPSGANCRNCKIKNRESLPLVVFETTDKGLGIKTQQTIKSGSFIIEYVGEILHKHELENRLKNQYSNDTHHYAMHLEKAFVVDSRNMGNLSRFINHSCQPNAKIDKWVVNGLPCLALFSTRNINPEEEITFDYNYMAYNANDQIPCKCGAKCCRKFLSKVLFKRNNS